jgi:hypothetical protein
MIPALRLGDPWLLARSKLVAIAAARAGADPRNLAMVWGRIHISVLPFPDLGMNMGAPESALPWSLLMGTIPYLQLLIVLSSVYG